MTSACRDLTLREVCDFLRAHDRYLILTHASPDGDTLGSGFALCAALRRLGKRARVACPDGVPEKYRFFAPADETADAPAADDCILAVDIADEQLLGSLKAAVAGRVALAVDHHVSNTRFAAGLYLDAKASATCECIYELIGALGLLLDRQMSDALYTGIATDTGCFKYSNVTPRTHRIAAALMEQGIDAAEINRVMFDTKSRAGLALEQEALRAAEYHFGGRCLILPVTLAMREQTGCCAEDVDRVSVLSRSVEGVQAGVTIKQVEASVYKISLRTYEPLDAAEICRNMGGGGHRAAAGCTLSGTLESVRETVLKWVGQALEKADAGTAAL